MFQKQLSTEDEKSKKLKITEKHLKIAKEERTHTKITSKKIWGDLPLQYREHGNSPCCLPISINFMLVGHTHFSPDQYFG